MKFFHNDAECAKSIGYYPEIGINLYNPGIFNTLAELRQMSANQLTILGNIPPRDVLAKGSPADVARGGEEAPGGDARQVEAHPLLRRRDAAGREHREHQGVHRRGWRLAAIAGWLRRQSSHLPSEDRALLCALLWILRVPRAGPFRVRWHIRYRRSW